MKLGFIGGKQPERLEENARFAKDHGYEALEFDYWDDFENLTDETVEAMRGTLDANGVGISAYGLWGYNYLSPDREERSHAHAMLDRAIRYGGRLGARILVVGGGDIPDATLAEKVKVFCEVFPPLLDRIETAGMRTAFYALHGTTLFDCIEAYERVWEQLPQVGIKFDPANWNGRGYDYLDILRRYGNKVAHMHIKEHIRAGGKTVSQPAAGMGDIEWGKVIAWLYEHGYDGYLSVEPHGPVWSKGEMREKMLVLSNRYIGQFLV